MAGGRAKKLIAVPENVVEELSRVARRSGLTVSELITMILSHALRVLRGRENVVEALEASLLFDDARRLGATVVPLSLLSKLLERLDGEALEEAAREAGRFTRTLAVSLAVREPEEECYITVLKLLIPSAIVENVWDGEGRGRIVVTFSQEIGRPLYTFLKAIVSSVLDAWGYNVTRFENYGSTIVAYYERRAGSGGG